MSDPITLLLVDDEQLVRKGFRAILQAEPGLTVVGEASDGDEVEALVDLLHPDVVLMDVRMPRMNGLEATARLVERGEPSPRVLILTTFESDDHVYEALRIGADGFVLKRVEPEELVRAIETVARSDALLYPAAIRRLATSGHQNGTSAPTTSDALAAAGLSDREQDVLRLVARGLSNGEIADELVVSVETVKSHVASMLAKLGVRDRTQAVIRAYESGFISRS